MDLIPAPISLSARRSSRVPRHRILCRGHRAQSPVYLCCTPPGSRLRSKQVAKARLWPCGFPRHPLERPERQKRSCDLSGYLRTAAGGKAGPAWRQNSGAPFLWQCSLQIRAQQISLTRTRLCARLLLSLEKSRSAPCSCAALYRRLPILE